MLDPRLRNRKAEARRPDVNRGRCTLCSSLVLLHGVLNQGGIYQKFNCGTWIKGMFLLEMQRGRECSPLRKPDLNYVTVRMHQGGKGLCPVSLTCVLYCGWYLCLSWDLMPLSFQVMYRRILQQAGFIHFAQLQFLEAKELFR